VRKKISKKPTGRSPLRSQRSALNCSAIRGGGKERKKKKGRSVSGYLNAATRLQLAGIGTPFLQSQDSFIRVHTRGEADTASYVLYWGSYPKMWYTQEIKLTSHVHLTLRLRMHGATPPFLHTHIHGILYLHCTCLTSNKYNQT
jgi:hypothetical protein